jgi:hypothetical protein
MYALDSLKERIASIMRIRSCTIFSLFFQSICTHYNFLLPVCKKVKMRDFIIFFLIWIILWKTDIYIEKETFYCIVDAHETASQLMSDAWLISQFLLLQNENQQFQ